MYGGFYCKGFLTFEHGTFAYSCKNFSIKMTAEVPEKSWELSHYELHRQAQPLMSNKEAPTTVSSKVSFGEIVSRFIMAFVSPVFQCVHSDLRCPICLDLLTSTMTTVECLHRFCAECIITALRSGRRFNSRNIQMFHFYFPGNKECPTCRKKLVSKRSLRPDPNFDQLVAKLFPDKDECDEQEEKAGFAHVKRLCKKRYKEDDDEEVKSDSAKKLVRTVSVKFLCVESLSDEFNEKMVRRERLVETSSNASVEHMIQYLKTRIEIELGVLKKKQENENSITKQDRVQNVKLFTLKEGEQKTIEKNKSLADLIEAEPNFASPLEIYFTCDLEK